MVTKVGVLVEGRHPHARVVNEAGQHGPRGLGDGQADGEANVDAVLAQGADVGQELLAGTGGIGADEDGLPVPVGVGDLRQAGIATVMWSAAVLLPALPGRSSPARASPVLSRNPNIGW